MSAAWAALSASGFSTRTCLPASRHFAVHSTCASFQGEPGARVVGGVRGGDVDDLDVGVGHELLVGAVGPGQAVLGGEGGRPAGVARPDGL